MNPLGLFVDGKRQSSQAVPQLKLSAQISGEYAGRQSIRDMFLKASAQSVSTPKGIKKPSYTVFRNKTQDLCSPTEVQHTVTTQSLPARDDSEGPQPTGAMVDGSIYRASSLPVTSLSSFQSQEPLAKRQKTTAKKTSNPTQRKVPSRGQQSLMGFLQKSPPAPGNFRSSSTEHLLRQGSAQSCSASFTDSNELSQQGSDSSFSSMPDQSLHSNNKTTLGAGGTIVHQPHEGGHFPAVDPIATKEKWSQLFTKPAAPRCEVHDEPCTQRITRKSGANFGRAFWMCSRLVPTSHFDCVL